MTEAESIGLLRELVAIFSNLWILLRWGGWLLGGCCLFSFLAWLAASSCATELRTQNAWLAAIHAQLTKRN